MGREPILIGIDGDGVHRELMGGSEDTNSDFLARSRLSLQQNTVSSFLSFDVLLG
jgi:hypothetical protein